MHIFYTKFYFMYFQNIKKFLLYIISQPLSNTQKEIIPLEILIATKNKKLKK